VAASLTHPTKFDKLTAVQHERILTQLVQGVPNAVIARQVGVTARQIQRYKAKHLKPVLAVANQIATLNRMSGQVSPQEIPTAVQTISFAEKLEQLWQRLIRCLDRAEAERLDLMAGLLNQGHRNLKLLGTMTGELSSSVYVGPVIQMVVPERPPGPRPEPDVIEIRPPGRRD
jgi:hypothetical protein